MEATGIGEQSGADGRRPSRARLDLPAQPRTGSDGRSDGRIGLLALATAAFVYVTAETLPVGLLPQLATGLHVGDGSIGLLVTAYAAVAGLSALPVTAWVGHRSRREVVITSVTLLAVSQFVMAAAPDYAVVLGARIVCALAHGVFWAMLATVAAGLVSPEKAGRATAVVYTGNSLALVFGTPLATALGQAVGWRLGVAAVGLAAAASAVALRLSLPPLRPEVTVGSLRTRLGALPGTMRNAPLAAICVIAVLIVTGHFTAYTYISSLVRTDAGLTGLALSAVLLLYGVAGVVGIGLTGWVTDRRPRLAAVGCGLTLTAALAGLAFVGPGSKSATLVSVVLWGAAFTAVPVCLQSAVLRVAPRSADTASALYVVAFQIGIGGGALAGSVLVDGGHLASLPVVGMALAAAGTIVLIRSRRAFTALPAPRWSPVAASTPSAPAASTDTTPAGNGSAGWCAVGLANGRNPAGPT
jgi:predicted MFS family arabinose efflux permease